MRVYKFERREDEETGEDGWLLKNAPETYRPVGGYVVAHDILEHMPKDNGSVEHELLALGAVMYVRGTGGFWNSSHIQNPGYFLGGDFRPLVHEFGGLDGIENPGRTAKLPFYIESWIEQAVVAGIRDCMDGWDDDDGPDISSAVNNFFNHVPGWLRRGFRASQKRYINHDSCDVVTLFNDISRQANTVLKCDDQSMTIRVNYKDLSCHVEGD